MNPAKLREAAHINLLVSTNKEEFVDADWYRMIACVQESNAEFEGFLLRDLPGRPSTLLSFPVTYSDEVMDGEAFGGMWSYLDEAGAPKHHAAFVRMILRGS